MCQMTSEDTTYLPTMDRNSGVAARLESIDLPLSLTRHFGFINRAAAKRMGPWTYICVYVGQTV